MPTISIHAVGRSKILSFKPSKALQTLHWRLPSNTPNGYDEEANTYIYPPHDPGKGTKKKLLTTIPFILWIFFSLTVTWLYQRMLCGQHHTSVLLFYILARLWMTLVSSPSGRSFGLMILASSLYKYEQRTFVHTTYKTIICK